MLPPGHPLDFFVKQPKTKKTQKSTIHTLYFLTVHDVLIKISDSFC